MAERCGGYPRCIRSTAFATRRSSTEIESSVQPSNSAAMTRRVHCGERVDAVMIPKGRSANLRAGKTLEGPPRRAFAQPPKRLGGYADILSHSCGNSTRNLLRLLV